ncbi:hypothetical protein CL614_07355 [archaeon]|nr:hypothetical protein [archaeon]
MNELLPSLVGSQPFGLMQAPVHPVTAIARADAPNTAAAVLHHALRVRENESRRSVMRAISGGHRDIACTWLQHRNVGESHISIATGGGSHDNRMWFSAGENVALRTDVHIS